MKGTYITQQAKCVKVLDFDATNKMAYVDFGEGDIHWVGEPEYANWAKPTYVPDIPEQIIEQPKIKEYAIQIGEPKTVSLDETPGYSPEVEQGISQSEEPTQEGKTESKEKVKKTRTKKQK